MSHTVNDLRSALFDQLQALRDPKKDVSVEIQRSRAMSEVGRTILESAKVELEHQKLTGDNGSGFLGTPSAPLLGSSSAGANAERRRTQHGIAETIGNVTRHTLK